MRRTKHLAATGAIDWASVKAERLEYPSGATVYAQGDPVSSIIYVDRGRVRLSVLSYSGREAIVAVLDPGDFFGESCVAGELKRPATATTMGAASVVVIALEELICQVHRSSSFANRFLAHTLRRNLRIERDLIDHLFNNCEKRLARTLLLLAHYGGDGPQLRTLPKVSQELLAEMIGTTRTRVNYFMNRFRKLGYVEYEIGGDITVHQSLLGVVLRPDDE